MVDATRLLVGHCIVVRIIEWPVIPPARCEGIFVDRESRYVKGGERCDLWMKLTGIGWMWMWMVGTVALWLVKPYVCARVEEVRTSSS